MAISYDIPQIQAANISWTSVITAANTARDGTGTLNLAWTAGADGSWIYGIRFIPNGANVATLARVILYDGSTYKLWNEYELPVTTNSATAAQEEKYLQIGRRVPAGWTVHVILATAVAAGWSALVEGDDY